MLDGSAEWYVAEETFAAGPGMAIYHAPDTLHRMINIGDDVLRLVYFWWAPNGNREVLTVPSELLEPVPQQPAKAKFPD